MEMVAASKMRKAQDRMATSRPYATKIRQVISHVAQSSSEYHHPYLVSAKNVERVGFIVVTSDRGLCGGLNINLFRALLKFMQEHQQKGVQHDLCLIGRKGKVFFKRHGDGILGVAEHLGDKPACAGFSWRGESHAGCIMIKVKLMRFISLTMNLLTP